MAEAAAITSAGGGRMIDARPVVDELLKSAIARRASDVHVEPVEKGYELRLRIDGLLELYQLVNVEEGRAVVARLMVMAGLLTYRVDVPQEGRLSAPLADGGAMVDLRLAVMPTSQGLRATVRMPAELIQPRTLEALGLPDAVMSVLRQFAAADAGMLVVTGPAGAGKTTTLYALLEFISTSQQGLSIITLEDPVERHLRGVTQIEVSPFGELTYERALKSILRQDPQVLMLGEIRDAATATLAVQAALSGHRLLCTLHAADPAGAIQRLIEMGIEPYQIASAIFAISTQRLVRKKTGGGRVAVAEAVVMDAPLRARVLERADAARLRSVYSLQPGYGNIPSVLDQYVARGVIDPPGQAGSSG